MQDKLFKKRNNSNYTNRAGFFTIAPQPVAFFENSYKQPVFRQLRIIDVQTSVKYNLITLIISADNRLCATAHIACIFETEKQGGHFVCKRILHGPVHTARFFDFFLTPGLNPVNSRACYQYGVLKITLPGKDEITKPAAKKH